MERQCRVSAAVAVKGTLLLKSKSYHLGSSGQSTLEVGQKDENVSVGNLYCL